MLKKFVNSLNNLSVHRLNTSFGAAVGSGAALGPRAKAIVDWLLFHVLQAKVVLQTEPDSWAKTVAALDLRTAD